MSDDKPSRGAFLSQASAEYFIQACNAVLEEFVEAGRENDIGRLTLAGAAAWQLGVSMTTFFKSVVSSGLLAKPGLKDEAQRVATRMHKTTRDILDDISDEAKARYGELPESDRPRGLPEKKAPSTPGRNLN